MEEGLGCCCCDGDDYISRVTSEMAAIEWRQYLREPYLAIPCQMGSTREVQYRSFIQSFSYGCVSSSMTMEPQLNGLAYSYGRAFLPSPRQARASFGKWSSHGNGPSGPCQQSAPHMYGVLIPQKVIHPTELDLLIVSSSPRRLEGWLSMKNLP